MKNAKRFASLLLALVMVFSLAATAFAATVEVTELGSITIKDNETVLASKKTFAAHKILDLKAYKDETTGEITNYAYSVPTTLADFYADRYDLDKTAADFATKVVAEISAEEDIYAFAKAALEACTAAGFTGKPIADGYQFTGLSLGYYVIEDTTAEGDYKKPVSALVLDTVTPNVEVVVKAEIPPIEKKIDKDNNLNTDNDRVDANQAAIGDTVTYVITSKVPDMTGYKTYYFIVHDTMSKGLTYNDNLKVTIGDKVLVKDTDYFVTTVNNEDGTTYLKVVFHDFEQYQDGYVGQTVTVSYDAILNDNAEINKTPNPNEVYLEYSNNPNVENDGDDEPDENTPDDKDPTGETPKDKVETFTTSLEIIKIDPLGNRLEGAEFTLTGTTMNRVRVETENFTLDANGTYWKLKDGSFTTTDPETIVDNAAMNKDSYASLTDKYAKTTNVEYKVQEGESLSITATVGKDGTVRFEGLAEGEYVIKEIKAPEGYNILTETLNVTITWDEENGFTYEGAADVNGVAQVKIVNQSGTELPSTGGMGTTMFYLIGGIMVLAAVVLLVTRRRMAIAE